VVSFAWLAQNTSRIQFGPLVTPVSFRHPAMTVRMASAVDDLSGGRLVLGVGTGWNTREHANYSFDLRDMDGRFARFDEALRYITHVLKRDEPYTNTGTYYRFNEAVLLPRPQRPGGPPILIGGNGTRRTLPLVVRYADEWNGVYVTAARYAELNGQLTTMLTAQGRDPASVRRSLMTGLIFGRTDAEIQGALALYQAKSVEEARQHGIITGTADEVKERLAALAEAGVQRVMLQWLDLDNLAGLEAFARAVL
jgi:alkanesulfonate monooxygenase SsuD/methylene tetrahydromethanopterin reductase-like flavin-dependent oxidoreductase (luciferase family)